MSEANGLPLEKEFSLQTFYAQADKMSREQAVEMLKELYRHHLITIESYNQLLKTDWGIGNVKQ